MIYKLSPPDAATLASITKAARGLSIIPDLASLTTQGKAYEAWLMFEVAQRLSKNFTVTALDHACVATSFFIVRGGPGNIRPSRSAGREPCHFEIKARTGVFELHNSLEHVGGSKGKHELDLSIVEKASADLCRATLNGAPYDGSRRAAFELKAHSGKSSLGKSLGRAFVGAALDLDMYLLTAAPASHPSAVVLPHWTIAYAKYWLVTSTTITKDTANYLSHYGIQPAEKIRPSTTEATNLLAYIQTYLAFTL